QDGTIVAINAPDLFNSELLPEQGAALAQQVGAGTQAKADALADTKIKRRLPADATPTPALVEHLLKQGFTLDLHESILLLFCYDHISLQTSSDSGSSEFRNWIKN